MKAIGVEAPYMDTKSKKTTITREMHVEVLDNGTAYLNVKFQCSGNEVQQLRTCASSFYTNLTLVCQTIQQFGNWEENLEEDMQAKKSMNQN